MVFCILLGNILKVLQNYHTLLAVVRKGFVGKMCSLVALIATPFTKPDENGL